MKKIIIVLVISIFILGGCSVEFLSKDKENTNDEVLEK